MYPNSAKNNKCRTLTGRVARIFDHVVVNTSRGAVMVFPGWQHCLEACTCWQIISGVQVEDNLGRDNLVGPPRLRSCFDRSYIFRIMLVPHFEVDLHLTVVVTPYVFVSEPLRVRLYETNISLGQNFGPRVTVYIRRSVSGMPLARVCQFGFENVFAYSLEEFVRANDLLALFPPAMQHSRRQGTISDGED